MRVALIGSNGFLGRAIFKGLYDQKVFEAWHVYSSKSIEPRIPGHVVSHIYKWPEHSLADVKYAASFIESDVIIYAAGAGIQPGENVHDEFIFNMNLFEPARLIQHLIRIGFSGQLITFGSYFETGINKLHSPLNEEDFLEQNNPLPNIYCRSKKELSHLHFVYERSGISFKWLHLVLTNIYGPGENGKRLIPYIINQASTALPLHFTNGSQIRQYTFIGDVVDVVGSLSGKASGMYHVTNPDTISVREVINATIEEVKSRLAIYPNFYFDLAERRDTAMDYLALSPDRLFKEWGLRCETKLKDGISFYFN